MEKKYINNDYTQSCTIYCTRWFKNLSVYTITPKSNNYTIIPIAVAVFQLNVSFSMYAVTHPTSIAKNTPSQNPPSNVNPHIFSNHRFHIDRYPYHQSQSSKQQGRKDLHHVLCVTKYKCKRFLSHVSSWCRSCDVTCNRSTLIVGSVSYNVQETLVWQLPGL